MQYVMIRTREWIRCGKCRNKLFKWTGTDRPQYIEIKCHSCKALNVCDKKECSTCVHYYDGCCTNFGADNFSHDTNPTDTCESWERRENIKAH